MSQPVPLATTAETNQRPAFAGVRFDPRLNWLGRWIRRSHGRPNSQTKHSAHQLLQLSWIPQSQQNFDSIDPQPVRSTRQPKLPDYRLAAERGWLENLPTDRFLRPVRQAIRPLQQHQRQQPPRTRQRATILLEHSDFPDLPQRRRTPTGLDQNRYPADPRLARNWLGWHFQSSKSQKLANRPPAVQRQARQQAKLRQLTFLPDLQFHRSTAGSGNSSNQTQQPVRIEFQRPVPDSIREPVQLLNQLLVLPSPRLSQRRCYPTNSHWTPIRLLKPETSPARTPLALIPWKPRFRFGSCSRLCFRHRPCFRHHFRSRLPSYSRGHLASLAVLRNQFQDRNPPSTAAVRSAFLRLNLPRLKLLRLTVVRFPFLRRHQRILSNRAMWSAIQKPFRQLVEFQIRWQRTIVRKRLRHPTGQIL